MTDYFLENMIYLHTGLSSNDHRENDKEDTNNERKDDESDHKETTNIVDSSDDEFVRSRSISWWSLLILFSSLSLGTRLHKLDMDNQVCVKYLY